MPNCTISSASYHCHTEQCHGRISSRQSKQLKKCVMFVVVFLLTNHHHSAFFLHSLSSLTFSLRATSTKSALLIPSKHIKQKLSERIIPLQAFRKTPFWTTRKIKLPLLALGQGREENGEMKIMNTGQEENQANEEHNEETEISDAMKWEAMYQQGNKRCVYEIFRPHILIT